MTIRTQGYGSSDRQTDAAFALSKLVQGLVSVIAGIGSKTMAKTRSFTKALQLARMMSVLSSMSDDQLFQIGISRSEIPKYAKTLMADDK
ncbi:hypothetical protein [Pseudohalocynthiibacter sp. F2068]|jgi:uncharacterized protein YjiS (DUF1127 family)|uniref:DUF1127 domain-containing protein n=1 Tax=Pseudohalocynthiibacter sp. F2068 TaxID=2926418 RepID=UPI001FF60809|nr:hypothetical protein [Pseudohalocynthiibacter sp. F2068]MCK0104445.1 hypothetical protein [Pseudohalocynthiibacter sp. F2068]